MALFTYSFIRIYYHINIARFGSLSFQSLLGALPALHIDTCLRLILLHQIFLGLNFLFNAIMWGLFTRALTLATSTTRVSVINTSSNFLVTAILSALIFYEVLPPLWWLGAAFLVAGSVIIGSREDDARKGENEEIATELSGNRAEVEPFKDDEDGSALSGNRVT